MDIENIKILTEVIANGFDELSAAVFIGLLLNGMFR
jgi:hypothetical protein